MSLFSFGTDKNNTRNNPRHKHEDAFSIIQKMDNEQLLRLIDYMFEAKYIPDDLWKEVTTEITKRNIVKEEIEKKSSDIFCEVPHSRLIVEKMIPDSISHVSLECFPVSDFYDNWDEDYSKFFKDEISKDSSYIVEMENNKFGCFTTPTFGPISSPFGWRYRYKKFHKGIDIQQRKGDTIVVAFNGVVRLALKKGGYGNVVVIRHYNGLETVYAHLSKIRVKEGDVLSAGDLVGLAGNTGKSTGPHLHFEVRFKGVAINPMYIISFEYGSLLFNIVEFKKNKYGVLSAFHPDTEFHIVEKGETLAEIANHYGTTVVKLRKLNDMKGYVKLKQGQELRVKEIFPNEFASSFNLQ
ncbi:MAG: M23 family metallopeptidase [Bacteroidota bacterium]